MLKEKVILIGPLSRLDIHNLVLCKCFQLIHEAEYFNLHHRSKDIGDVISLFSN